MPYSLGLSLGAGILVSLVTEAAGEGWVIADGVDARVTTNMTSCDKDSHRGAPTLRPDESSTTTPAFTGRFLHHVAVVGVGSIGQRHVRCFLDTGRAQVSFVDANSALASHVAERYRDAKALCGLEAAAESGITAAVIATPAPLHVPIATQLANAGIHVLIEKPLAVGPDGVEALKEVVSLRNVVAGVAYVYRLHPAMASMRSAILSGRLGRPVELVAVAGQHFPTYRPTYRETYYASHANGGGAVQDALTHVINAGEWLVGPVTRLIADADRLVLEGVEVEDTVHVMARHGDVLASYSLNQHQSPNETTITVICDNGVARFEFHASRWRMMLHPGGEWIDSVHELGRDELFTRQANAFLDAIERHDAPPCTLDEGTATFLVNRAILRSVRDGAWQSLGSPHGETR